MATVYSGSKSHLPEIFEQSLSTQQDGYILPSPFPPPPPHTHTHTHTHLQYGDIFSFTMLGKTFTYLIGSEASSLFFNSRNENLNAEEVYSRLVTPVFGKGVAYDVPNKVVGGSDDVCVRCDGVRASVT